MATKNGLASNAKQVSIGVLNARLADGIDLALAIKQAHWNLKGATFIAIHEMLDQFRTDLDGHVDTMAERVAQLGGTALGTAQAVTAKSALAPYPLDIHAVDDHVGALSDRFAATSDLVRQAIDETDDAGDAATADIFTAYQRSLDKALWFLESHLPAALD